MAIWRGGKPAKARDLFSHALVQEDNRTLVFGVDWAPLLGSRTDSVARKKAAELKATHYTVITNNGQTGLGTVKLGRAEKKEIGKRKIFPAAAAFAIFRPMGTAVGFFALEDGRIWLVLSQNGMIRRNGDLIYEDEDTAWKRYHQLQAEAQDPERNGPNWSFYSNLDIAQVEQIALEDLLNVEIRPFEARNFSLDQLPKPVKVCLWLLMGFFAVNAALDAYQAWSRDRRLAELRANMQDPEQAWQVAISEEAQHKRVDSLKGVEALYQKLVEIPLDVAGWRLHEAACEAAGMLWQCTGTFLRKGYGATNDQFEAALPKGWKARFDPLGTAQGVWSFSIVGSKTGVAAANLPTREKILRSPVSQLQSILPAFTSIRLPNAEPWNVAMPVDGNGKPVSRPSNLAIPGAIPLLLEGPLRSLSVWEVESTPTAIRKIVINRVDAEVKLNSSPLKMTLTGDLYVQNAK